MKLANNQQTQLLTDTGEKLYRLQKNQRKRKFKIKMDLEQSSMRDRLGASIASSKNQEKQKSPKEASVNYIQRNRKVTLSFMQNSELEPQNLTPKTIASIQEQLEQKKK